MIATRPRVGSLAWLALGALGSAACSGALDGSDEHPNAPDDPPTSEAAEDESDAAGRTDAAPSFEEPTSDDTSGAEDDPDTEPPSDTPDPTPDEEPSAPDDDPSGEAAVLAPSTSIAPRLTQAELNNALRDLIGDDTAPASIYLAEDEFSPYDNDATRQTVSSALVDSMQVLAEDVAARMAHDVAGRSAWMPCEPDAAGDATCFDETVSHLARAFFRRPFGGDEVAPYRVLLTYAEEQDDFYVGVESLLSSLIQDPEFLYRLERGTGQDVLELDDYEIATRLSFLLHGSVPDASLLEAADAGMLRTAQGRRDAAERLLTSNAAQRQLYRFHAMWLGYRAIPHDATLNAAFQQETERLIERVVFEQPQSYLNLFTSTETYLTDALAAHYGLPPPADGTGWVSYPADAGRAGILSHGSVLSAFSKFSDTSPTQRGIFVRERLLCQDIPPPPPTVDVDQPPGGDDAASDCKLDRYRAHREQSGCVECHSLFDPIGEGLENYDIAGRYREHDDGDESCAIEALGSLPGYGEFRGPAELATLLVEQAAVQDCFVRQYLQYSLAKGALTGDELDTATALAAAFTDGGLVLNEWFLDFVSAERFAQKRENDQ